MTQTKKTKKIPMRKCVVSGQMFPKKELVRIVKTQDNEVFIDPSGRKNGRGAYIALVPEYAEKARKEKSFNKVFGINIADDFYDQLYEYVDHQKARQELL
ncbi:RNase P modulator RnpM [Eremococcus coleocola]|uniref:YlxR domain-containing protein n=1 Tax=Eremococcus coleocola ACS-139-V-Col8 TaxID=908337 RepID=E4KQC7_9LACT|nr:YlxR family protein [Eremococcus coleocola]EFR30927.1 hypothetical protein HMPREF9257_1728 [Eremococcus coleocola ACS-139-V-Col8]